VYKVVFLVQFDNDMGLYQLLKNASISGSSLIENSVKEDEFIGTT
jgi:hypothetical protein